jgi:hypothetical protein
MNDKMQFEYDTLLIWAWKKDICLGTFIGECKARSISTERDGQIDMRGAESQYRGSVPIRAVIARSCDEMSRHLWACKEPSQFVLVRNKLNRGDYKFKKGDTAQTCMVDQAERREMRNANRDLANSNYVLKSIYDGQDKLGGANRTKRYGAKKK